MKTEDVLIRGVEQIDKIDPLIIKAMDKLSPEDQIPIYYTGGLMEAEPRLYNESDRFIGIASNVRKDEEGNYVCNCVINEYMTAAKNFDNVIDNVTVTAKIPAGESAKDNEPIPKVAQLVVYDLEMKREFDRIREQEQSKEYREGDVPFPSPDENPLKDENFKEAVHESVQQFLKGGTNNGNSESV